MCAAYDLSRMAAKKLKFLVSLTTNDNDYQIAQGASAQEEARLADATGGLVCISGIVE